jgi:hypothetical protein
MMLQASEEKPARGQASGDQDGDRPRLRILALPRAATLLSHHGTSNKRYALVCPCWAMHPDSICSIHACLRSFRLSPGWHVMSSAACSHTAYLNIWARPVSTSRRRLLLLLLLLLLLPHPPLHRHLHLHHHHHHHTSALAPQPIRFFELDAPPSAARLLCFLSTRFFSRFFWPLPSPSCILLLHLPTPSTNSRLYHRKPFPSPHAAAACQFQCH